MKRAFFVILACLFTLLLPAVSAAETITLEAAELELEAAFVEVAAEARHAFAELLVAQQKNELFEDALQNIKQTREVVKTRVDEGAQSPYDLLRLDMEVAELLTEHEAIKAELRQAQAEAVVAGQAQRNQERRLRADFEQAAEHVRAHEKALRVFRERTQDHLPRLREMAETAYAAGQGGILELLDALQTINTLKATELELLAELYKARVDLDAAAGHAP